MISRVVLYQIKDILLDSSLHFFEQSLEKIGFDVDTYCSNKII